ncbi:MAG: RNA polymerase factor sigma-54 [Caldimicrobium sp.]
MIEVKNQLKLLPQLILTPQLKLLLKVLQLNTLELNEYLLQEVQSNPFLEVEFNDIMEKTSSSEKEEIALTDEFDWSKEALFEETRFSFTYENPEEEGSILEKTARKEETLSEHLLWQLGFIELTPKEREIADFIMGNLDEKGYLSVSLEELAKDLGVSIEEIEKVRNLLKKLDPVGVASLDLKECLLTQLEFMGYSKESLPYILVERHLEEIPEGIEYLSQKYGYNPTELDEALYIIRNLEPYPARNFFNPQTIYIEPDLRFYKEDNEWKVEVVRDNFPKVYLNNLYYKISKNKRLLNNSKNKEFLKEKFKIAETLLKALDSRYSTLYKVGEVILQTQKDFLEKGSKHLKPLTLKDVAQKTGLHESTISRVISHKYVDTPLGIFPLKFFFTTGYSTDSGKSLSVIAIKDYIKEIIEKEDPKRPYSDSQIAKILKERYGINIARRTVTKYREELNIPSIRERKKHKSS